MIHLTTHQLSSYLDRELPESSTELVRRHLEACQECTLWFAAIRDQEAVLDRILVHDPGEEFFARFADEVLGQPKSAPAAKSSDRRGEADRRIVEQRVTERRVMERRVGDERRGAVAAEAVRVTTPAPATSAAPPEPAVRSRRDAPPAPTPIPRRSSRQPAIPWFAAAVLCLIVGAIGYTLPRPERFPGAGRPEATRTPGAAGPAAPPALDAHGPAPTRAAITAPPSPTTQPSPPSPDSRAAAPHSPTSAIAGGNVAVMPPAATVDRSSVDEEPGARRALPPEGSIAPVRRIITTTEALTAPVTPPKTETAPKPRPAPDEFAAVPLSAVPLVEAARKASRTASLDSSAANLDAAASAWEQAIPALSGAETRIAREKLAEARYRAWMAAPDPYRAAAATASLRAFLVLTPPGPRHDLARTWLKRINGG